MTDVLDIEKFEVPEEDLGTVVTEVEGAIEYAFIGSGQGGGRIATEFYNLGYRKTIVVNTSPQDLNTVPLPEAQRLLLDIGASGAGKDMARGERAAEKHGQAIVDLMRRTFGKVDHIMICISAGGGSGGGSAIPLVLQAKKYLSYCGYDDVDKRVGVIVSLPTRGEAMAPKIAANAFDLATKLSEMAEAGQITPLVMIDNDKFNKLYPRVPVKEFLPTVNRSVAQLFDYFNRLPLNSSEFISFDPEDYRNVIRAGGHCIFGVTTVKGVDGDSIEERHIAEALRSNLEKTLLAGGFDLGRAGAAGCVIIGGQKMFAEVAGLQQAIEYSFDTLSQIAPNATVHRGLYQREQEVLSAYTILSGLPRPAGRYEELARLARRAYP